METKEYINKKNRIFSDLKVYCSVNRFRIIFNTKKDQCKIFNRDFCVAEICIIKQDQSDSFLILFAIPMLSDFTMANVTILRPIIGDKDIRDFMGNDRLLYKDETLKILRNIKIQSNKPLSRNLVSVAITALFNKVVKGTNLITNKMDFILQVKLN